MRTPVVAVPLRSTIFQPRPSDLRSEFLYGMRTLIASLWLMGFGLSFAQGQSDPTNRFFTIPHTPARPDSLVDVIVEFVEDPYFIAARQQIGISSPDPGQYLARFSQFASDIGQVVPSTLRTTTAPPSHKFYRAFFGSATRLPAGALDAVRRLPYVKKVHPNSPVRAFLDHSVAQVRANAVWSTFGMKGDGVVVGIIDSGVDYLHPALGGGIGPEFKVVGGYDFVNGDDDPMDDEGHGTHVAGIVAADGDGLQGVAPNVRLYAFKVLDAGGNGTMADVIAAIERTVDPNSDGDPSDRLDVVNMSLGSSNGDPDDAASTAVDHATRLGVVFCVAAGNAGHPTPVEGKDGNYYFDGSESIGSPGTARLAITVGAVNDMDQPAAFSSKGPVRVTFGIKPDVVAPGVDITSLALSSGTTDLSGTSMASPHVAGVAALVRSMYPDWTPDQVKSAIVASARDLSIGPMQQGSGRVDAFRAVTVTTMLEPTNLGFGLDDPAVGTWVRSETLTVRNMALQTQSYQVAAAPTPAGVTVTASPASFELDPNGAQSIVVTLSVSNAVVPIVDEDIEIYGGQVVVRGSVDTVHAPWAFVRTSRLLLTFDEPGASFMGASGSAYFISDYFGWMTKSRRISPTVAEVIGAPSGVYDITAFFPHVEGSSRLVVREQVPIGPAGGTLAISSTEALYGVQFQAVDALGLPLQQYGHGMRGLLLSFPTGIWANNLLPPEAAGVYVSSASNRVSFHGVHAVADYSGTGKLFVPQFQDWVGMTGPVTLTNDPASYVRQRMQIVVPPDHPRARIFTELFVMQTDGGTDQGVGNLYLADTADVANGMVSFDAYLSPEVGERYSLATSFHVTYSDLASGAVDVAALYFTARHDSVFSAVEALQDDATYRSADGDTLTINAGPAHLPYHNVFGPGTIQFFVMPRGPVGEFRYRDLTTGTYTIRNAAGEVVDSGSLADSREPLEVPVGVYTSEVIATDYRVGGAKGQTVARHRFDLSQTDPATPVPTLLRVLDERGRSVNVLRHQEAGKLRFGFKVIGFNAGAPPAGVTRAYYRVRPSSTWIELPLQKIGDLPHPGSVFSANVSAATAVDSVGVDLRLTSADANGNTSELLILPAFAVGNWQGGKSTDVESPPVERPGTFALEQNFPNPFNPETLIRYRVAQDGSRVHLAVYDLLGREVAVLVDETRLAGDHAAVWTPNGAPSGVYVYRLTAGGSAQTKRMVLLK